MKKNTITRKIQLIIDDSKEDVGKVFETLYNWQEITFRAYNFAMTHRYFIENIRDFIYIEEGIKVKVAARTPENPEGILTTSQQNAAYQILSAKYKGQINTDVLTNINQRVNSTFATYRKELFAGTRSLSTYRRNVPIPFSKTKMLRFTPIENDKGQIDYAFTLLGINFKTFFGRDLSGNRLIFSRALEGDNYSFAGSQIQLAGKKIFLLLSVQFESAELSLNADKTAIATLSFNHPIEVSIGKKTYHIGTKEGYLHRRLAIQAARRRTQKNLKFNNGGHGRSQKLKKLEDYERKEKDYVDTILHKYSLDLVNLCLKNKVGTLTLSSQEEERKSIEARIKEINNDDSLTKPEKEILAEKAKFVISNWSYYGLTEKIKYKAQKFGLNVVIEK